MEKAVIIRALACLSLQRGAWSVKLKYTCNTHKNSTVFYILPFLLLLLEEQSDDATKSILDPIIGKLKQPLYCI